MPYVDRDTRVALSTPLHDLLEVARNELAGKDPAEFAGVVNYIATKIATELLPTKKYWALELASGALRGAAREFERRVIAMYENQKIRENGDVYSKELVP